MRIELRPARPDEVAAFFAGDFTEYDLLKVGDHVVAMGCFTVAHGRTWAFLDIKPHDSTPRVRLVRGLRKGLERRGGVIHVACQEDKFPTAPRLLSLLGFEPTDEVVGGERRVWTWRN